LAAVTIPVLELTSGDIYLSHVGGSRAQADHAGNLTLAADLPAGFRALWLRTACVTIPSAGHAAGIAEADVNVPEEFCRFLSLAPQSFQEIRLLAHDEYGPAGVECQYLPRRGEGHGCDTYNTAGMRQHEGLQAKAAALQQFTNRYGLAVSVSDDETHLLVTR